jgi:hypothetical protein
LKGGREVDVQGETARTASDIGRVGGKTSASEEIGVRGKPLSRLTFGRLKAPYFYSRSSITLSGKITPIDLSRQTKVKALATPKALDLLNKLLIQVPRQTGTRYWWHRGMIPIVVNFSDQKPRIGVTRTATPPLQGITT